jgi:hypothetical protein
MDLINISDEKGYDVLLPNRTEDDKKEIIKLFDLYYTIMRTWLSEETFPDAFYNAISRDSIWIADGGAEAWPVSAIVTMTIRPVDENINRFKRNIYIDGDKFDINANVGTYIGNIVGGAFYTAAVNWIDETNLNKYIVDDSNKLNYNVIDISNPYNYNKKYVYIGMEFKNIITKESDPNLSWEEETPPSLVLQLRKSAIIKKLSDFAKFIRK